MRKVVLKNFAIFTEKLLCWGSLFNKVAGLQASNVVKKRLQHMYFEEQIFWRTPAMQNFTLSFRSSHPKVFLRKGALKICSKFTREHPYRSAISIKLQSNFIEVTRRHGCSPVKLLHIFSTPLLKNTSGRLLLKFSISLNNFLPCYNRFPSFSVINSGTVTETLW